MEINTVLFDLDDTLIDTKIYSELYESLLKLAQEKLSISDKELEELPAKLNLQSNKDGKYDTGDLFRKLDMLDVYYEELEKAITKLPPQNPKIKEVFDSLIEMEMHIGIVSNSMDKTIRLFLKKHELMSYIDLIFSADRSLHKKSNPEYWKALIEQEKIDPEECMIIGDDPVDDEETPKQLGFQTLRITDPSDFNKILDILPKQ